MQWGEETGKEAGTISETAANAGGTVSRGIISEVTDSGKAVSGGAISEVTDSGRTVSGGAISGVTDSGVTNSEKSASGATAPGFLVQFLNDFEHRNPFRRGERNDLALKLGRVSRSKGFSKKELEEVISLFIRRYAATDFTAEDIRQRITAGYQFIDSLPQKRKFPARVQIGFISLMTPPSRPMRAPKKKICWKKQRTSCPVSLHSRQRIQRSAPISERLCAIRFRPARTRHHAAWQP